MVNKKDITMITVLYNPDKIVIENIKKSINVVGRIILVDNSSQNNAMYFKDLHNIQYIPLKRNTGIACALNTGIKASTSKFVLTMDQDSMISKEMITEYIKFLNNYDDNTIGALTPKYDTDRHHEEKTKGYEAVKFSLQSGTLFKNTLFDQIGYFKETLFIEGVDHEYFLRMKKYGYKLIKINSAVLTHHPAITKKKSFLFFKLKYGFASPIRTYYKARNLFWIAKKYHSFEMYKGLSITWLKILFLYENKSKYLTAFRKGIKDEKKSRFGKYE